MIRRGCSRREFLKTAGAALAGSAMMRRSRVVKVSTAQLRELSDRKRYDLKPYPTV